MLNITMPIFSNRIYGNFSWTHESTWVSLWDTPRSVNYMIDGSTCSEVLVDEHRLVFFSSHGAMIIPVGSCIPVLMSLTNPGLPLPTILCTYSGYGSPSVKGTLSLTEDNQLCVADRFIHFEEHQAGALLEILSENNKEYFNAVK